MIKIFVVKVNSLKSRNIWTIFMRFFFYLVNISHLEGVSRMELDGTKTLAVCTPLIADIVRNGETTMKFLEPCNVFFLGTYSRYVYNFI